MYSERAGERASGGGEGIRAMRETRGGPPSPRPGRRGDGGAAGAGGAWFAGGAWLCSCVWLIYIYIYIYINMFVRHSFMAKVYQKPTLMSRVILPNSV